MQNVVLRVAAVVVLVLVAVGLSLATYSETFAQSNSANSPSYEASEMEFGSGSEPETCSGQYCAQASIGDMSADGGLQPSSASFGTIPEDSDPLIEVIVDGGASNLGTLSATKTAWKTMTVRIRTYLTDGYTLQITGAPPKYADHTLKTPTTPTASVPGTEQFALNAVHNTSPEVGADPAQIPSDQFSFGEVELDYATPNLFKYVDGDVIASSSVASGRTDYTISIIVNISDATPAGHFSGDYSAMVVPRF